MELEIIKQEKLGELSPYNTNQVSKYAHVVDIVKDSSLKKIKDMSKDEFDDNIHYVLRDIYEYIGLKQEYEPKESVLSLIISDIRRAHNVLTLPDLLMAFQLGSTGEILVAEKKHYNSFTTAYVSPFLESYKKHKLQVQHTTKVVDLIASQNIEPLSDLELALQSIETIELYYYDFFNNGKKHKAFTENVYDNILDKHGLIELNKAYIWERSKDETKQWVTENARKKGGKDSRKIRDCIKEALEVGEKGYELQRKSWSKLKCVELTFFDWYQRIEKGEIKDLREYLTEWMNSRYSN